MTIRCASERCSERSFTLSFSALYIPFNCSPCSRILVAFFFYDQKFGYEECLWAARLVYVLVFTMVFYIVYSVYRSADPRHANCVVAGILSLV